MVLQRALGVVDDEVGVDRAEVTNTGGASASSVTVEGTLDMSGRTVETTEVTVDYVAAGVTEEFILVFAQDPADGEVTVQPTGFIEH